MWYELIPLIQFRNRNKPPGRCFGDILAVDRWPRQLAKLASKLRTQEQELLTCSDRVGRSFNDKREMQYSITMA